MVFFGAYQGGVAAPATCAAYAVAAPCTTMTRNKSREYAFYGQGTFAVTPTINLTAGVRINW